MAGEAGVPALNRIEFNLWAAICEARREDCSRYIIRGLITDLERELSARGLIDRAAIAAAVEVGEAAIKI